MAYSSGLQSLDMGGATAAPAATTMSDGYTDEEADMQRQIDWHARQAKGPKREATEDAIEAPIKIEKAVSRERVPAIPGKSPPPPFRCRETFDEATDSEEVSEPEIASKSNAGSTLAAMLDIVQTAAERNQPAAQRHQQQMYLQMAQLQQQQQHQQQAQLQQQQMPKHTETASTELRRHDSEDVSEPEIVSKQNAGSQPPATEEGITACESIRADKGKGKKDHSSGSVDKDQGKGNENPGGEPFAVCADCGSKFSGAHGVLRCEEGCGQAYCSAF